MPETYYREKGSTNVYNASGQLVQGAEMANVGDISKLQQIEFSGDRAFVGGAPGAGQGAAIAFNRNNASSAEVTADSLLSGFQSAITPEQIRAREMQEREQNKLIAEGLFNPKIAEAKKLGEARVGSTEAQFGVGRGLGLSTAETSFINSIQKEVDQRVSDIEAQKAAFIASGNFQAAQQADQSLLALQEQSNNLVLKKAELALALRGQETTQLNAETNLLGTLINVPAGQSVSVGGKIYQGLASNELEPFFKGSDIVDIMQSLPDGSVQSITDPNTGVEFQVTGVSTVDQNLKQFTVTDDSGNFSIVNFNPNANNGKGEILGVVTETGLGKSKTAPVSVNFPRQTRTPIYDATGKQIGFQTFNPIDLTTNNFDLAGNRIDFPSGGRLGGVSSTFEEDEDDLDNPFL